MKDKFAIIIGLIYAFARMGLFTWKFRASGIYLTPDSVSYLSCADELCKLRPCLDINGSFFTKWATAYPAMITVIELATDLDSVSAMK